MQSDIKFWDKCAPKYAKSPISDLAAYEYTLERTRSYLSDNDSVLELGCGTGGTAIRLADAIKHLTATDLSDAMLNEGRAKSPPANLDFVQSDVGGAPGGPFDVVMAFNLLHLIRDTDAALVGIHRRLKSGGLFISKTPCKPSGRAPLKYLAIRVILPLMQFCGKVPHVSFMSIADWEARVTAAGFRIIESGNHPAHPPSRYLVARKL